MSNIYTGKCEPTEEVQKQLLEVIFTAVDGALSLYKERVSEMFASVTSEYEFNQRYETILKQHTREIIEIAKYRLRENEYFLSRIDSIIADPSGLGFGSDFTFDAPCHAGFICSAFWYALTDDPYGMAAYGSSINRTHNAKMEQILTELSKANRNSKTNASSAGCLSSSWPYLLGMLILGLVIGLIISLSQ